MSFETDSLRNELTQMRDLHRIEYNRRLAAEKALADAQDAPKGVPHEKHQALAGGLERAKSEALECRKLKGAADRQNRALEMEAEQARGRLERALAAAKDLKGQIDGLRQSLAGAKVEAEKQTREAVEARRQSRQREQEAADLKKRLASANKRTEKAKSEAAASEDELTKEKAKTAELRAGLRAEKKRAELSEARPAKVIEKKDPRVEALQYQLNIANETIRRLKRHANNQQ